MRYKNNFIKLICCLAASWFIFVNYPRQKLDAPCVVPKEAYSTSSIATEVVELPKSTKNNDEKTLKLIQDISTRVENVETFLARLLSKDLNQLKQVKVEHTADCEIFQSKAFPKCKVHYEWMKEKWKSDNCFATWGVDGSSCSILIYLSEVESWCHPLPGRKLDTDTVFETAEKPDPQPLMPPSNFQHLYENMGKDVKYEWIKKRIESSERRWVNSARKLLQQPFTNKLKKKTILVQMGLLYGVEGKLMAKNALIGKSPLGELVQWADIIASLYALGHDVHLMVEANDANRALTGARGPLYHCPSIEETKTTKPLHFDVIYTDIHAMKALKNSAQTNVFDILRCKFRVVDSFGTHAAFNNPEYAKRKKLNTHWSGFDLNIKQFNTMFPHTADNTFLGFVSERPNQNVNVDIKKENISVGYGKSDDYWKSKDEYVNEIVKFLPVHGTFQPVKKWSKAPQYVINHGVLSGEELVKLLQKAKIFFGLGFPFEGPGPLEAIANGAVYINPLIHKDSPESKRVEIFFKDKPTFRRLTSQSPYCEKFIGYPHVRNVDKGNIQQVHEVLQDVLKSEPVTPYLPYEYTYLGMLERLAVLVDLQDFCSMDLSSEPDHRWPPLSAFKTIVSTKFETCEEACERNELRCDPSYFDIVNQKETFSQLNINCTAFVTLPSDGQEVDHPSFKGEACYLQSNKQLLSCAGRYTDHNHLCPCRDYIKGQVSMCKTCLSPHHFDGRQS